MLKREGFRRGHFPRVAESCAGMKNAAATPVAEGRIYCGGAKSSFVGVWLFPQTQTVPSATKTAATAAQQRFPDARADNSVQYAGMLSCSLSFSPYMATVPSSRNDTEWLLPAAPALTPVRSGVGWYQLGLVVGVSGFRRSPTSGLPPDDNCLVSLIAQTRL